LAVDTGLITRRTKTSSYLSEIEHLTVLEESLRKYPGASDRPKVSIRVLLSKLTAAIPSPCGCRNKFITPGIVGRAVNRGIPVRNPVARRCELSRIGIDIRIHILVGWISPGDLRPVIDLALLQIDAQHGA